MIHRCVVFILFLVYCDFVVSFIGPSVTTQDGRLQGIYMSTRYKRKVAAFLGVPYAKPPVGELRFEPPQPAKPWRGVRLAVTFPAACAQTLDPLSSEDCLYLDVYTPKVSNRSMFPVYVFVHGGSYQFGSSSAFTYEYLLDEDIVLVVPQYRLGFFGFLTTGDGVVAGNMGIKDVRQALRWVQRNIKSFGGDPEKVTIGGESAGAVTAHYLMLYSAGEGLFRAGISQSGTALNPWAFYSPIDVEMTLGFLVTVTKCPRDSVMLVKCLRDKPAVYIMILFTVFYRNLISPGLNVATNFILPLIGAVLEPECAKDRLVTRHPWEVNVTLPWLVGSNSKEAYVVMPEVYDESDNLFRILDLVFNSVLYEGMSYQFSYANGSQIAEDVRKFYFHNRPISKDIYNEIADGVTDALFVYPFYEAALRAQKNTTYVYYFEYMGANQLIPVRRKYRKGTAHGDELWFFFPHPYIPIPVRLYDTEPDRYLSRKLLRLWTNFITHLDPTPDRLCDNFCKWPAFSNNHTVFNIIQNGTRLLNGLLPERMDFWKSRPYPYRNDKYKKLQCYTPHTLRRNVFSERLLTSIHMVEEDTDNPVGTVMRMLTVK